MVSLITDRCIDIAADRRFRMGKFSPIERSDAEGGGNPMSVGFPNESAEYRAAREALLQEEIALRRAMEAVAVARRKLPPGGLVPEDYVFEEMGADGAVKKVRLSELFA